MIGPGRHGGDGVAVATSLGLDPDVVLDLSATLNPWAPDLGPIVSRHTSSLRRYPDRRATTAALAEQLGTDPGRVLLTNGGSEAIALVARAVGGGVVAEPEFALHPRAATGPRWRSDPHSPTGRLAGPEEQAAVWDEAFYPLATGRWTAGRAATITVGSLTKVFACPGLRLGYVVADDVERVARLQPEWPVGALALAVLDELLQQADLAAWHRAVVTHRARLAELFTQHGMEVRVADGPWILVAAPELRSRLAPHGVVVRDCGSFAMPGWSRVAVTDEAGLARVATALDRSAP